MTSISATSSNRSYSSAHVISGVAVPKTLRVLHFSPDEWEDFVEEWTHSLKASYSKIRSFGGSGDLGVDIAGFINSEDFSDTWDNYQCKHYAKALTPSNVWVEIGKIIYYSFLGKYSPPRNYYFVAPKEIGTKLSKLLCNPNSFKEGARKNWSSYCQNHITETTEVKLEGKLLYWFNDFDFSIFSSKSLVELVEEHSRTPFHTVRFGGGLPQRTKCEPPPDEYENKETPYIEEILKAYSEHLNCPIDSVAHLSEHKHLEKDLSMQRQRFYSAEALCNFARDNVPEGTFEDLQEEILYGVEPICRLHYKDGYARMQQTIIQAANVSLSANPLISVVHTQDRQGICHQLVGENKLQWITSEAEGDN